MTSPISNVAQKRMRYRFDRLSFAVMCLLGAAAFAPPRAFAACSPPGTLNNVTVNCSGATATVMNFGLIEATGNTIDGGSGFIDVTNNSGGTITTDNGAAINNSAFSVRVTNAGTISTTAGLSGTAINAGATATVINLASGLITSDGSTITAQTIALTNFGVVSATGFGASAVSGNTVVVTNSGSITNVAAAAAISMITGSIVNNAGGTISGDSGIEASSHTSIFNAGTITGTVCPAIAFFGGGNTLTLAPRTALHRSPHAFRAAPFPH